MQSIETWVLNEEAKRCQALVDNSAEALAPLLSSRMVFVHSSGVEDSRSQLLNKLANGALSCLAVRFTDLSVQILPGEQSAMVSGVVDAQVVLDGREQRVLSRYLAVWCIESDGALRLLAHQGTPLTHA